MNDELLAISQDQLRKQARLLRHDDYQQGWQEVWAGSLSANRWVIVFINGLSNSASMNISLSKDVGVVFSGSYWVRDPVIGSTIGSSSNDVISVANMGARSSAIRILHF